MSKSDNMPLDISNCKAVIFDFDGVIVESVGVKIDAFRQLFLDYPQHIEEIIAYHMEHGGVSRFKKFEYIYREILKEPLSEEKSQKLGELFTQYSHQKVISAPFVKGANEFLEKYYQNFLLFVASGTPQEEMDAVVRDMNLEQYFKEVHGSPKLKKDISERIMERFALAKDEVIFVGDSKTDYEGARQAGIPFIGRVHESFDNPFEDLFPDEIVQDLTELDLIFQKKAQASA